MKFKPLVLPLFYSCLTSSLAQVANRRLRSNVGSGAERAMPRLWRRCSIRAQTLTRNSVMVNRAFKAAERGNVEVVKFLLARGRT